MEDKRISEIYERHSGMVYRLCLSYMKNEEDALDAVQNTFYRMIQTGQQFDSVEHEKAWLIVTASNICKNVLKHWWRKRVSIQEDYGGKTGETSDRELLMVVFNLPRQYRVAIYLYYYEGYSSSEIAKFMGKSDATVRWYLMKGRELLKKEVG